MNKIIFLITLVVLLFSTACKGDNVYSIEGYAHGSVVCLSGGILHDGGVMYTINKGHTKDKEAIQLLKEGGEYCEKYLSK